jgi:predicted transposase YbfD/YdcC
VSQNIAIIPNGQVLIDAFSKLDDPRVRGRCLHRLTDIIFITVCAIICGAQHWNEISEFGLQRIEWLKQFIKLEHGIPSHQTIGRVFALIPADDLLDCFMEWSVSTTQLKKHDLIAIDGKTLRKSSHEASGQKALHLINAFVTTQGITLGSIKTPDKSNEIKGIPPLLKALPIEGCTITIDAMGTQRGIANLIVSKNANYVLALKENHKGFYKKVKNLFEKAKELNYEAMVYENVTTTDYDHSRYEKREYTFLPLMYLFQQKRHWAGLQTFIQVKSIRHVGKKIEESFRYYISSLCLQEYQLMAKAIRYHWRIENSLHWKLDVAMQEDHCRIYHPSAAENFSTLRKLVLQLLEKDRSTSKGIAFKQWKAALNTDYLQKLVGF